MLEALKIGSLFSGAGGIELGLEMVFPRARVAWQAESDPHALAVLAHHWPEARRYTDVREIDEHAERPDIICGGFPCQDISLAGKGAGIDGERSGLWSEFARVLSVLRPDLAFVENVAALVGRGLDRVLRDLAEIGFDAEWETLRASDIGAPHRRERVFVLAYADRDRVRQLAEWGSWRGPRERTAEREHAESLDDGAALADADGEGRRSGAGDAIGSDGGGEVPIGPAQSRRRRGTVAEADGRGQWQSERDLRARERHADGSGEVKLADADGSGREGNGFGEPPGAWRSDAAECGARSLADANGNGCEGERLSGVLGRERAAHGGDANGRHGSLWRHRFPPGPAWIAGWDGPQPAIRRGDDGVPGRSHRLRLLGNACVPQQAAEAFVRLIARADGREAA